MADAEDEKFDIDDEEFESRIKKRMEEARQLSRQVSATLDSAKSIESGVTMRMSKARSLGSQATKTLRESVCYDDISFMTVKQTLELANSQVTS